MLYCTATAISEPVSVPCETRRGAPKAIKAMARYLACIIYRTFTRGRAFVNRGVQEYESGRAQRELAALQFKAAAHGFRLVNLQTLPDAFMSRNFERTQSS